MFTIQLAPSWVRRQEINLARRRLNCSLTQTGYLRAIAKAWIHCLVQKALKKDQQVQIAASEGQVSGKKINCAELEVL